MFVCLPVKGPQKENYMSGKNSFTFRAKTVFPSFSVSLKNLLSKRKFDTTVFDLKEKLI